MRCLVLFLLVQLCSGLPVFLRDKDYTFPDPLRRQVVYASFTEQALNKQFFAANFKKGDHMHLEVFVPVATKDDVVVLQVTGHPDENPLKQKYSQDVLLMTPMKKVYKVDSVAQVNTTVIVEVSGLVSAAHYAVVVGKAHYWDLFETTIAFPYVVQRVRLWSRTFYLPFIYAAFVACYLLLWPLSRNRAWEFLPRLASLAYLAWIVDAMLQYFITIQFTSDKNIISFLLHILPNATVIYFVAFSQLGKSNRQKTLFLACGLASLLLGGAGGYVGALLLLVSAGQKYFQFLGTQRTKEKLICKV